MSGTNQTLTLLAGAEGFCVPLQLLYKPRPDNRNDEKAFLLTEKMVRPEFSTPVFLSFPVTVHFSVQLTQSISYFYNFLQLILKNKILKGEEYYIC